jgi:hypothetical protein
MFEIYSIRVFATSSYYQYCWIVVLYVLLGLRACITCLLLHGSTSAAVVYVYCTSFAVQYKLELEVHHSSTIVCMAGVYFVFCTACQLH